MDYEGGQKSHSGRSRLPVRDEMNLLTWYGGQQGQSFWTKTRWSQSLETFIRPSSYYLKAFAASDSASCSRRINKKSQFCHRLALLRSLFQMSVMSVADAEPLFSVNVPSAPPERLHAANDELKGRTSAGTKTAGERERSTSYTPTFPAEPENQTVDL